MSIGAGPPATPSDRLRGQDNVIDFESEITRIRTSALAWRNGLAGMLVALLGFSLIRGRADISLLAHPFNAVVGIILLIALLIGVFSGLMLLRAAHGYPSQLGPRSIEAQRLEGDVAIADLKRGLVCALICGAVLVAAVGATWYGPGIQNPSYIEVSIPGEVICGSVVLLSGGVLTLKTSSGERQVAMTDATGLSSTDSCTSSP
jgi:hypothetical protein